MTARPELWAVIAGGGTAGHVMPGLSVARELLRRGTPREALHWVGSTRGVETRLVPEAGFNLTALPGSGFRRRIAVANASSAAGLLQAFARSRRLLRRWRPAVVIGLGGYASAACGAAAAVQRVPLVIAEQNAVPGAANRVLSRFASAAATAFEHTQLRGARFTGNPVRSEVCAVDRAAARDEARASLGVKDGRRLVAVFGGSLGARSINEAVAAAAFNSRHSYWQERDDLQVRHISGRRDHGEIAERLAATDLSGHRLLYDLVCYEDDMAAVYAAADAVVCRAGATTVAELAVTGAPAVLVPLPGAPRDHQTANAKALAAIGASVTVPDCELDAARLVSEVDKLLSGGARSEAMALRGAVAARHDAAAAVVDLVEECASRPRPGASL